MSGNKEDCTDGPRDDGYDVDESVITLTDLIDRLEREAFMKALGSRPTSGEDRGPGHGETKS
jgi:hypothetical protein